MVAFWIDNLLGVRNYLFLRTIGVSLVQYYHSSSPYSYWFVMTTVIVGRGFLKWPNISEGLKPNLQSSIKPPGQF